MKYLILTPEERELYHHGILGMHWGIRRYQPYPKGSKGGKEIGEAAKDREERLDYINKKRQSYQDKTASLQKRKARYEAKAIKFEKKANRAKRSAANPLVAFTDFRESANYKALRREGKSLVYKKKAVKMDKKIANISQKDIELGKEQTAILRKK